MLYTDSFPTRERKRCGRGLTSSSQVTLGVRVGLEVFSGRKLTLFWNPSFIGLRTKGGKQCSIVHHCVK